MKYKFTVKKYATDDFGDNRTDLNKFEIGAEQSGVINNANDVDYFTFKTDSSNSFYYFDIKSIDGDIEYKIFSDAEMTEEVFGSYSGEGEAQNYNLEKKLKPSTQYYLQMSGGHEMDQVHYQFCIRKVADDVEDTADKAKRLELNKSYNQTINNDSDIDCFKFSTSNYIDYNITFKSTTEYGDVDYAIYKDKEMTVLLKSGYLSGKSVLSRNEGAIKLTPYRTYYIKVTGKENSKYTIGVNASAPANNKAKAQTVTVNTFCVCVLCYRHPDRNAIAPTVKGCVLEIVCFSFQYGSSCVFPYNFPVVCAVCNLHFHFRASLLVPVYIHNDFFCGCVSFNRLCFKA